MSHWFALASTKAIVAEIVSPGFTAIKGIKRESLGSISYHNEYDAFPSTESCCEPT